MKPTKWEVPTSAHVRLPGVFLFQITPLGRYQRKESWEISVGREIRACMHSEPYVVPKNLNTKLYGAASQNCLKAVRNFYVHCNPSQCH